MKSAPRFTTQQTVDFILNRAEDTQPSADELAYWKIIGKQVGRRTDWEAHFIYERRQPRIYGRLSEISSEVGWFNEDRP